MGMRGKVLNFVGTFWEKEFAGDDDDEEGGGSSKGI